MSIRQEIKELQTTPEELRKFSWTVGIAFLLIAAFLWWKHLAAWPVLAAIGGGLIVLGTIYPPLVRPFFYAWMSLAVVLGFVMTRVILTIFFFLVLTPVGLFFRLIGRDAMHRKIDRKAATYWIEKEYLIPDRSRLEKFF